MNAQIPRASVERFLRLSAEVNRRLRENRIRDMFPDDGPLRRELYQKHMEFFAAGAEHNERCMIAGNRCITPWTAIEMGRATRRVSEILGEPDFCVQSWADGSQCTSRASGVFLKGIEPAFRVYLDTGDFFDCSRKHRVLTREGWFSLAGLIRASSGLHCTKIAPSLKASYGGDDRPSGGQPPPLSGSDQGQPPSQGGVLERPRSIVRHGGGVARKSRHIRTLPGDAHRTILDDPSLIAGLCGRFEDPEMMLSAQWPSGLRQELSLFSDECGRRLALLPSELHQPFGGLSAGALNEFRAEEGMNLERFSGLKASSLSLQWVGRNQSIPRFLYGKARNWIFSTFSSPQLVTGSYIATIVPLGLQPILDFNVEETNNYVAGGAVHHNTGKTFGCGGYETTLHLTGDYPAWWVGRRFDKPITAWAVGETSQTTRDVVQATLAGPIGALGTGLIPKRLIVGEPIHARGVANAIDTMHVRHVSGGTSMLGFRSYDQGRTKFQGVAKHLIWLDEEPPEDVYDECMMRLMTTDGLMICTFTPLLGLTKVALRFLPHLAPGQP